METRIIDASTIEGLLAREKGCEELVQELLDGEAVIEEEYGRILADCHRCGVSERELWQTLALYRKEGVVNEKGTYPLELDGACGEKLRQRILTLIGVTAHIILSISLALFRTPHCPGFQSPVGQAGR